MITPPSFPRNKRILFCVLNWGLGHASRSIEVIDHLIESGNDVVIASDGNPGILLKKKFPDLDYIELPSYGVRYPTSNLFLNFLANAFNIFKATIKEKNLLVNSHKSQPYDILISDNRPGCIIADIPCYYITHQLNPYHPNSLLQSFFTKINNHYIHKYQEIWIPDYDDQRLSGTLSNDDMILNKTYFLGPLSAYQASVTTKNRVTVLLSGPEPQRTKLENSIYEIIHKIESVKFTFIRGTLAINPAITTNHCNHIKIIDLCSLTDMNLILNETKLLISRTGYSTIMDIDRLAIPHSILIPTRGQTEQEYLGVLHKKRFTIIQEKEVKIKLFDFFNTFV